MADLENIPEEKSLELQPSQDGMHPAGIIFASEAGTKYGTHARKWQGILGIERANNGRLCATWYSGKVIMHRHKQSAQDFLGVLQNGRYQAI